MPDELPREAEGWDLARVGRWRLDHFSGESTVYDCRDGEGLYYNDAMAFRSRADISDLIALLERVRERLPP